MDSENLECIEKDLVNNEHVSIYPQHKTQQDNFQISGHQLHINGINEANKSHLFVKVNAILSSDISQSSVNGVDFNENESVTNLINTTNNSTISMNQARSVNLLSPERIISDHCQHFLDCVTDYGIIEFSSKSWNEISNTQSFELPAYLSVIPSSTLVSSDNVKNTKHISGELDSSVVNDKVSLALLENCKSYNENNISASTHHSALIHESNYQLENSEIPDKVSTCNFESNVKQATHQSPAGKPDNQAQIHIASEEGVSRRKKAKKKFPLRNCTTKGNLSLKDNLSTKQNENSQFNVEQLQDQMCKNEKINEVLKVSVTTADINIEKEGKEKNAITSKNTIPLDGFANCHDYNLIFTVQSSLVGDQNEYQQLPNTLTHSCSQCNKNFCEADLNQHNCTEIKDKHWCNICNNAFKSKIHLCKHRKRVHNTQDNHLCEQCGATYKSKCSLKKHYKIHLKNPVLKCEHCDLIFDKNIELESHIFQKHADSDAKQFFCDKCDKMFTSKGSLKRHVKSHRDDTGQKKYKCELCIYSTNVAVNLSNHIKTHNQEKLYECSYCNKCFSSRTHFKRHERIHICDKSYSCNVCGREFSQSDNLKRHMRKHNNDRPYKCTMCGKDFFDQSNMLCHMRTHSEEKPYKCDFCELMFKQINHAKSHMIYKHTRDFPHKCTKCPDRGFMTPSDLKRHKNFKHNNVTD